MAGHYISVINTLRVQTTRVHGHGRVTDLQTVASASPSEVELQECEGCLAGKCHTKLAHCLGPNPTSRDKP